MLLAASRLRICMSIAHISSFFEKLFVRVETTTEESHNNRTFLFYNYGKNIFILFRTTAPSRTNAHLLDVTSSNTPLVKFFATAIFVFWRKPPQAKPDASVCKFNVII